MTSNVFIHIGDVHLQAGHPRNADRLNALDQIIQESRDRRHLSAWLIPGDLFHQRSTVDDRNSLADRLTVMANRATVVLVRGNHDQPGDLDIYARLKAQWPVFVVTRPTVLDVPLATGERAVIACLPYPDRHGFVSAGVEPAAVPQTAAELLDVIFLQFAAELSTARVGGAIPLFLGHVNVRGSIASTGQPQIGMGQEIDRISLTRLPVVYCGLSHIHKPQEVGVGVYAGSIAAMDHGETEAKSYVVVECTRLPDGSWAGTWTREPINTPPMHHINATFSREAFRLSDDTPTETAYRFGTGDWGGCDVRVRYTFQASEKAVLDHAGIREIFASALRLKIEAVAIPDRELRAPAVAAAKTLPEKLAALRKVQTLESSIAEKLALLEQQPADRVLATVAGSLAHIERGQDVAVAA